MCEHPGLVQQECTSCRGEKEEGGQPFSDGEQAQCGKENDDRCDSDFGVNDITSVEFAKPNIGLQDPLPLDSPGGLPAQTGTPAATPHTPSSTGASMVPTTALMTARPRESALW